MMAISNEKMIGQQILARIDHLIEVVFATGHKNPPEAQQAYDEGCHIIAELFNLLEQIIGPQKEYINTAIKELVAQRIPDQRLLNSFDDFHALLDQMCQRVDSSNNMVQDTDYAAVAEVPVGREKVELALDLIFPHETILKKHRYHGIYFDYYLPTLKIAIEEDEYRRETEKALREFLCRRDGIRVVSVDNNIYGYREIARQIKRQLAM